MALAIRACARVDGRVGYLPWLIDGFISVETILDLSGMPPQETLALLEGLVERGVAVARVGIDVEDSRAT
jgi:hypothetical protein